MERFTVWCEIQDDAYASYQRHGEQVSLGDFDTAEEALAFVAALENISSPVELLSIARALREWEAGMGGFDSPLWDRLRSVLSPNAS